LLAGSRWKHTRGDCAGISRQLWRKDCVSSSAGSASEVLESRSLVRWSCRPRLIIACSTSSCMVRLITYIMSAWSQSRHQRLALAVVTRMHVRRVEPLFSKRVAYRTQLWFLIRPMPALLGNPCINTKLASFLRLVKLDRVGR
jgi:hypothetical protein